MKAMQIYEELKQHSLEWIRSFTELAKQYEAATPEHREMVPKMLRDRRG